MFNKRNNIEVLLFSIFTVLTVAQDNLIAHLNYDLETDSEAADFHWVPYQDCTFDTVNVSYGGARSLSVSNRTENVSSPTLILDQSILQPGKSYHYSIYINFLNTPPELQHFNVTLKRRTKVLDDESTIVYYFDTIGDLKFQRGGTGWLYFGGDTRLENIDFEDVRFFLDFDNRVDYLFDTAVLVELPQFDPDTWKTQLNDTITAERTNFITIQSNISDAFQPSDIVIKVDQTRNSFLFGGAVKLPEFYDSTNFSANYRDFLYDNFNMGVPSNDVKWKQMENPKGQYNTELVDLFLSDMNQRGFAVRGHTIVWSRHTAQPYWLVDFSADPIGDPVEVRQELDRYIRWFCGYYGNSFDQLDVYNEQLHVQFYEDFLQEPDLIYDVFRLAQENCTGLFVLNDFGMLNRGTYVTAQMNLVNNIMDRDLKLDAIGAQCHVHAGSFDECTLEFLEKRTNLLCSTGQPIVVTELSVEDENVTFRASKLEEMLMFFYSKPCIFGVNYWALSDQNVNEPFAALADGVDVIPNEAGQVWIDLVKGQWETHQTLTPTNRLESFQFRGHHGDYSVTVTNGGEVVQTSSFTLIKGQDLVIPINL